MDKIYAQQFKNEVLGSGFTITQLCEVANVTDSTVSKWINTPRSIKVSTYNKLVDAFKSLKEAE